MKRKPLVSDLKANEVLIRQSILYARVSSGPQEKEGFSIPAQLKFLREYAADHQIEVLKEFIDVDSAKVTGRPEYSKMLAYLRKNTSVSPHISHVDCRFRWVGAKKIAGKAVFSVS